MAAYIITCVFCHRKLAPAINNEYCDYCIDCIDRANGTDESVIKGKTYNYIDPDDENQIPNYVYKDPNL